MSIDRALCVVDALIAAPRTTDELALICEVKYDTAMKYVAVLRQAGRVEFDGYAEPGGRGPRPSRWRWVTTFDLVTARAIEEATGAAPS